MALDTQTFGITRYWLSIALDSIQRMPDIFAGRNLNVARKSFLAGKNQLTSIKNWLICANVIESGQRGTVSLTDLGKLIAAKDERAECPWTWWMFHLQLCVNDEAYPYSSFFTYFDSDGKNWMTSSDVRNILYDHLISIEVAVAESSLKSYFEGIDNALCPGTPLYNLRLIERRQLIERDTGRKTLGIRRTTANPPDIIVAYASLLFRSVYFPNQLTIETRLLLEKGLAKSLGVNNAYLREALTRIQQDHELNHFLNYSQAANIDSVQFPNANIKGLQKYGYTCGDIVWT